MKLNQLSNKRKSKAKTFVFDSFFLDKNKGEIKFHYNLGSNYRFTETLRLTDKKINWQKVNNEALNQTLFSLHLIIGISYWKTFCPKKIIINSGNLTKKQAEFWNGVYGIGLGEFYYKNKIDFRELVKFPYKNNQSASVRLKIKNRALVPLGGGKDSIAAAEILKENNIDFTLFSLRNSKIHKNVTRIIGKPRIMIDREMDKNFFEISKKGYQGHIPVSFIFSFTALLAAILYDYKYIIFANEHSSNFGNVKYLGHNINHQYSKSLEAERNFINYAHSFITPDIHPFSLLRPFSELKIVQIFSKYKKYFSSFSSCSKSLKFMNPDARRWCGECAKCAFVFSQLAAFLSKAELKKIFGKNLYADKKLLTLYLELLGEKDIKPFDCVGTPEEVKAAMIIAQENKEFLNDYIIRHFRDNIMPRIKNQKALVKKALNVRGSNCAPKKFQSIINQIK
ncbi:MAG: hypothetical protein WC745_00495 [Patescibacteria group bacterium]|jgi:hypothetical protein